MFKCDTCITITRTLQSNSKEKSLEMQHKMWRNFFTFCFGKTKDERWNSRFNATMCFMFSRCFLVMIFVSQVSLSSAVLSDSSFNIYSDWVVARFTEFPSQVSKNGFKFIEKLTRCIEGNQQKAMKRWETGHTSSHRMNLTQQFTR